MRILLVEDEAAVQSYVVNVLEKAGHAVVTETNGNRAFRRYCNEGPFDLVLTDIEHKGMNGVELMQTIVSADLKGIHFSRFQGEPDGGLMSPTHTGTLAAFGD
jgi:two-component system, cell cycle response regulator CpdR